MSNELTTEDINLLMEALETWKNKEQSDAMLGSMLGAIILSPKTKEDQDKYIAKTEDKFKEIEERRQLRDEQITLLKAKLIQMKTDKSVEDVIKY